MRMAIGIGYNGSYYHGWQRLGKDCLTIQAEIERALAFVANHPVLTVCAGRTDAGVHATRQIVHFDSSALRDEKNWIMGVNSLLPADIVLNWIKPVADDFHARFKAKARRYIYIIYNHNIRPCHLYKNMTWIYKKLDVSKMQAGANYLLGTHDFDAYRTVHCQAKNSIRTIMHCNIKRHNRLIILDIQANAFLHHMVRNIVGVLISIGCGENQPEWAKEVMDTCDRRSAGITATPNGLYFVNALYDAKYELPDENIMPIFMCN